MKRTAATLAVGAIAVASISVCPICAVTAIARAADTVALLIDGTGNGDPNFPEIPGPAAQGYSGFTPAEMQKVLGGYFNNDTEVAVTTPEEIGLGPGAPLVIPLIGTETLNQSVVGGTADLNTAINSAFAADPKGTVVVYGVSQSAIIVSEEQKVLTAEGSPYQGQLSFVVEGDPVQPNGGIVTRLPGVFDLAGPTIGVGNYGAPPSSPYNTIYVSEQYDGISNFPQSPLDVVADANAVVGFLYQHPGYAGNTLIPNYIQQHPDLAAILAAAPTNPVLGQAYTATADGQTAQVTTERNSSGATDTYVLVDDPTLPLVSLLQTAGVPAFITTPLNTVLKPIVNAGYDPTSNPGADTPAQLLPPPSALVADVKGEIAAIGSLAPAPSAFPKPLASKPVAQLLPHLTQAPKTVSGPVFKPAAKPVGTASHLKHGK